jgi:RNA polymerase sigma-70 factor (ECF subfamily)
MTLIAPAPDFEHLDVEEAVAFAIAALPPLQRETLILAVYEGFSLKEIADTVAVEVGTVKARLHRARENLKRVLAPLKCEQPGTRK